MVNNGIIGIGTCGGCRVHDFFRSVFDAARGGKFNRNIIVHIVS